MVYGNDRGRSGDGKGGLGFIGCSCVRVFLNTLTHEHPSTNFISNKVEKIKNNYRFKRRPFCKNIAMKKKPHTSIQINLWSGPRNISTALMYAFAQRKDTTVFDEPLYAHYLSKTPAISYHPGSKEIIANMENDGAKVIEMMLGDHPTPVTFFKQMTHHLVDIDWSFMLDMVNIILTRDPVDMLPSYVKQVEKPALHDVGYQAHIELLKYLHEFGKEVIVLDSKEVLLNPQGVLTELCHRVGIPFDQAMLSWKAGPRKEDGVWAKYWYKNVHQSTAFAPYKKKTTPFPESLKPLLATCQPIYQRLRKMAILAENYG